MTDIGDRVLAEIWRSRELWADFRDLCALGGRLCGTSSEEQAQVFLKRRLQHIADTHGGYLTAQTISYEGWSRRDCRIELVGSGGPPMDGSSLLWSPPTPIGGLEAQVLDLGRGTLEDFETHRSEIPGRMVLVRHEYMFAEGHVHRGRKYQWAREFGAAAFLIASNRPGQVLVTGYSGLGGDSDIPAAGVTLETAALLGGGDAGLRLARLTIDVDRGPAVTENLILDLPGQTQEWVVLSAHLDGHDLGQSAMDNGSGVAAILEAARALAFDAKYLRRGLRVCLFSVEEWGLIGSRRYVDQLTQAERNAIALNINLDCVAGSARLTALTSGFAKLHRFLAEIVEDFGISLRLFPSLLANSDHYNFAVKGIPAFRLVAGFEEPGSNLRHVLTPGDTVDKVSPLELKTATLVTATIAARACATADLPLRYDSEGGKVGS